MERKINLGSGAKRGLKELAANARTYGAEGFGLVLKNDRHRGIWMDVLRACDYIEKITGGKEMTEQPKQTPVTLGEAEKLSETIKDPYERLVFDWLVKEVKRLSEAPKDERTLKELAKEVMSVQDASNLCGVVQSWARSAKRLYEISLEGGHGTDWVNKHPITKMWADKLASLSSKDTSYLQASAAVRDLAGPG